MALFSDRFINQVQQATDIVEVIGQYVALKQKGKEYLALCPFHDDHRPSLTVSPSKQIYKCFACGAGGGVFQFLMQLQKLTFPEAVRQLAERAGIPVPRTEAPGPLDGAVSGEVLVKVTTFAARFYRDRLNSPEGARALAYARGRGLTEESIRRFGLGYAPDAWDGLRRSAIQDGFSDRQLTAAGLAVQRDDGGGYDRFRNRLMFPILDAAGRVIAFGGRALDPPAESGAPPEPPGPKYLNSSQTVLFDKSANLYAVNWAREGIARSGQAVVVEGYLDALLPLQAGIDNVVATLGTSLTDRHVRMLGRYAREVVLVFDADTAGQAAAERAIEVFLAQRLHVRVAAVPRGGADGTTVKDPCDYVLSAGAEAFRRVLSDAPDALEFAWSRRREAYARATTLPQRRTILEEFLTLVVSSAAYGAIDALRQGLLANRAAELVGLPPAEVMQQMRRLGRQAPRPPSSGAGTEGAAEAVQARAERWLLGALLNAPGLFASVRDAADTDLFVDPDLRTVAEHVWPLAEKGLLELGALLRADPSPRWGSIVTDLQIEGERRGRYEQTVADACQEFLRRRQERELERLKSQPASQADFLRQVARRSRTDKRRRPKVP